MKRKRAIKYLIAVAIIIIGFIIINLSIERTIITTTEEYEKYLGERGLYKENVVAYNEIWPNSLAGDISIENFYYEYYNPWDPNYLGYMKVLFSNVDQYQTEIERLKKVESSDYTGLYGMKGFSKDLCAIIANDYGMIYALTNRKERSIVYVDLQFCNYFTDIDWRKTIKEEDLPIGLDVSVDNPTRKSFDEAFDG